MSRSIVDTLKNVKYEIDREGILFLYKGFGSTLFRDITFSSIYCYLYNFIYLFHYLDILDFVHFIVQFSKQVEIIVIVF